MMSKDRAAERWDSATDGYIKIGARNYVSRRAKILGPTNVELKGKSIIYPGVMIRGDFEVPIRIGRNVSIGNGSIVRPTPYVPFVKSSGDGDDSSCSVKFVPLSIGDHAKIGKDCVVEAAAIGASVRIGDRCVLSKRCRVKDCCVIQSDSVVPPDMILPPFSMVSGCPARIVGEVPESAAVDFVGDSEESYNDFVRTEQKFPK